MLMIARRHFFRKLLASFLATAAVPAVAWAAPKGSRNKKQGAAATPSPSPATPDDSPAGDSAIAGKNEGARLRFWKASDALDQPVQIRLLPYGKPDSNALTPWEAEAGDYYFSNYLLVPAGPMTAEITSPDRAKVRLPLHLAEGGQSTLLVRLLGTKLSAEWIDDSPDPVGTDCEFDVYNLLPASGDIQVDLGTVFSVHLSSSRGSLRLRGLKPILYPVTINGSDGAEKKFRWNNEADFRQYRKATLLIYPDVYGRIRPRISAA